MILFIVFNKLITLVQR